MNRLLIVVLFLMGCDGYKQVPSKEDIEMARCICKRDANSSLKVVETYQYGFFNDDHDGGDRIEVHCMNGYHGAHYIKSYSEGCSK
jgi:hypothetical protein